MDKIGIALAAVGGGILFVIAMLGFAAVTTYVGIILLVAFVAGLIVAGIVRLLQVKVRTVVSLAFWATILLVWAIGLMLSGHTLPTLASLIAGAALGAAHYLYFTPRLEKTISAEENIREYADADGHTHKYVLIGAQQLPPALAKRPVLVGIAMLMK